MRLPVGLTAAVTYGAISSLLATTRFEVDGEDNVVPIAQQRGGIFVCWHSTILMLLRVARERLDARGVRLVQLVSKSRDGEIATYTIERYGMDTTRGSSSRGGSAAVREMAQLIESGRSVGFAADGPRGPREQLKPGAGYLAQQTGAPVFPVAAFTHSAWRLNSWDRLIVPKPFARYRAAFGAPLWHEENEDLDAFNRRLHAALQSLTTTIQQSV